MRPEQETINVPSLLGELMVTFETSLKDILTTSNLQDQTIKQIIYDFACTECDHALSEEEKTKPRYCRRIIFKDGAESCSLSIVD